MITLCIVFPFFLHSHAWLSDFTARSALPQATVSISVCACQVSIALAEPAEQMDLHAMWARMCAWVVLKAIRQWCCRRRQLRHLISDTLVALAVILMHSTVIMCQGMAFSVAMNSKRSSALVALLIASNFVEIKGVRAWQTGLS